MPSVNNNLKERRQTISPEMRERQRIMSRMTPKERLEYKQKRYDERQKLAKSRLLELIEYCQDDGRISPISEQWMRIYRILTGGIGMVTRNPPLEHPLTYHPYGGYVDSEKRLSFLTQIYWCYKAGVMGWMYDSIMKLTDDDWHYRDDRYTCPEEKISLTLIKKEYASWLGVHSYDPVNNSISVGIRYAKGLDLSDIDAVDEFLFYERNIYELNHSEFSPLYAKILKYAIQKSVSDSNESLAETVILILKEKTKDYPELLEYALSASRDNHQLKRVLYNTLREYIHEVRDYKGDGSSFWYY
jgi:hypothetical protein